MLAGDREHAVDQQHAWPKRTCRWLAILASWPVSLLAATPDGATSELPLTMWQIAHLQGDLPLLSSTEHGPNSTAWRNSVAMCATMKTENSTDVREWLLHYRYAATGERHGWCCIEPRSPVCRLSPLSGGSLSEHLGEGSHNLTPVAIC